MIRILGGCMVFGGCLGLGFWYRSQLNGRIKALRELQSILELLAGEVRYGRATLPECCSHIARYLAPPFDEAFLRIGSKMEENTGISFGEVFREETCEVLAALPLQSQDRENFLRFANKTGFTEGQMQLRTIEQSMERLRVTQEQQEGENVQRCKMAVGLGAMGGLLLLLVLV